jgi:hypothetical protein
MNISIKIGRVELWAVPVPMITVNVPELSRRARVAISVVGSVVLSAGLVTLIVSAVR